MSGQILLRPKRGKLVERACIFEAQPEGVVLIEYEGETAQGKEYLLPRHIAKSYYRWLLHNGFKVVSTYRDHGPEKTDEKSADVVAMVSAKAKGAK